MKITMRSIGAIGALIFGTFFYFTFSVSGYVEEVGKDFIKEQIVKKTTEKIDGFKLKSGDSKLAQTAKKLYEKQKKKINELKAKLKNKAYEKLADVIAEMRNPDCECRKKYSEMFKFAFESQMLSLKNANKKLLDFMKSTYMEVATKLKRDIRIFTGSNAVVFLFLLFASFLKPKAVTHLFLPGILLVTATLVCSYFYIFEQNWLLTIIYSDYLGFAYLGYVGAIFLLLCDIVLNRARVTTEIINAFLNAIGSAVSVAPC